MMSDANKKSVKGKFLSEYPEIIKELDFNKHPDLDYSVIPAGSNKTVLYWICQYCNDSYQRNVNNRVRGNTCCPKKDCMLLKRSETNNTKFGWTPKYNLPKRDVTDDRNVPEPSEDDIEIWKDFPSEFLLSKYEISNLGNIKNKQTQYIFSRSPRQDGYIATNLFLNNSTTKGFFVHVLVAKVFLKNPENKPTVNHINCNRADNRLINLEWATYSEQSYKENKKSYRTSRGVPIHQYDLNGNFIKTWDKLIDAQNELKISSKNISKVLTGQRKNAGGFIWKYDKSKDHTIDGEIWKQIFVDTPFDKTFVSNLGRVKIKDNNPTFGTLTRSRYYDIKIYHNEERKHKCFRVHRLVCFGFVDNPDNKPFVNHKDNDPSNNNAENLEWMTNKENVNHALDLRNRTNNNSRSKTVLQIDPVTNDIINEFRSVTIASKNTNIKPVPIQSCCVGRQKMTGGYIWKYKNDAKQNNL